jgi:hypothetical protein
MERSVSAIWQGIRRRRQTEEDAAAARAEQPVAPASPAFDALDDTAPVDRVPSSLLAAAWDCPPRGATVRLAVGGSKVIAVVGGEGGDPYEWWGAIHWLTAPSGAGREAG